MESIEPAYRSRKSSSGASRSPSFRVRLVEECRLSASKRVARRSLRLTESTTAGTCPNLMTREQYNIFWDGSSGRHEEEWSPKVPSVTHLLYHERSMAFGQPAYQAGNKAQSVRLVARDACGPEYLRKCSSQDCYAEVGASQGKSSDHRDVFWQFGKCAFLILLTCPFPKVNNPFLPKSHQSVQDAKEYSGSRGSELVPEPYSSKVLSCDHCLLSVSCIMSLISNQ